jgi:hypothetical protein
MLIKLLSNSRNLLSKAAKAEAVIAAEPVTAAKPVIAAELVTAAKPVIAAEPVIK